MRSLRGILVGRDFTVRDDDLYVGDGKNIYRISSVIDIEAVLDGKVDRADVKAECAGVCDPDTYQEIMEHEDFDTVVDYVDAPYFVENDDGELIHDGGEIAFWDRDQGMVASPAYDPEKHNRRQAVPEINDDFYSSNAAKKAAEDVI